MEAIVNLLESVVPEGFQIDSFLKMALFLAIGTIAIGGLGRICLGKGSVVTRSVSSAISILFIYVITIVIYSFGVNLQFLLSPLPFVRIADNYLILQIYPIEQYLEICNQILSMVILAFLANLSDSWLPKGEKLFSWFFFRCLSVMIAMLLHLLAYAILNILLPEGFLLWAPMVLLALLVLMMMVGGLKILVGALISTVNPVIGALYTFFFANIIGKMISKAVLTTILLGGIVWLLYYLGITAVYIASAALAAYIPLLIILLLLWYLVGHIL